MANYYFLSTLLPVIKIGEPPEITFEQFENLLKANLRSYDLAKVEVIRRLYDLENIRSFLRKEPLDLKGTLDATDIEEFLAGHGGLPSYASDFFRRHEKKEDQLKYFSELIALYFNQEMILAKGFLKHYLAFEREFKLVLVGFRAKKLARDLLQELQFEDPDDDIVAQILVQKDSPHFDPPDGFEALKPIFQEYGNEPLRLYQALLEWKFSVIEEMLGFDTFSIDRILGYMVQLILVEKWQELDEAIGLKVVDTIIKEL